MVVSFNNVPRLGAWTARANYTMTVFVNGAIRINFGDFAIPDGVVGISSGVLGASYFETDFSEGIGAYSNSIAQFEIFTEGADSFDLANTSIHFGPEVVAAPEPSSTALLGLGGLALMLRRRR